MASSAHTLDSVLESSSLALDTMIFIYQFQKHPTFGRLTRRIFTKIFSGEIKGSASSLILSELLVLPYKLGDIRQARMLRSRIGSFPNLKIIPPGAEIADRAANLRAQLPLRLPDCLHLATAWDADYFITNDRRFEKVNAPRSVILADLVS